MQGLVPARHAAGASGSLPDRTHADVSTADAATPRGAALVSPARRPRALSTLGDGPRRGSDASVDVDALVRELSQRRSQVTVLTELLRGARDRERLLLDELARLRAQTADGLSADDDDGDMVSVSGSDDEHGAYASVRQTAATRAASPRTRGPRAGGSSASLSVASGSSSCEGQPPAARSGSSGGETSAPSPARAAASAQGLPASGLALDSKPSDARISESDAPRVGITDARAQHDAFASERATVALGTGEWEFEDSCVDRETTMSTLQIVVRAEETAEKATGGIEPGSAAAAGASRASLAKFASRAAAVRDWAPAGPRDMAPPLAPNAPKRVRRVLQRLSVYARRKRAEVDAERAARESCLRSAHESAVLARRWARPSLAARAREAHARRLRVLDLREAVKRVKVTLVERHMRALVRAAGPDCDPRVLDSRLGMSVTKLTGTAPVVLALKAAVKSATADARAADALLALARASECHVRSEHDLGSSLLELLGECAFSPETGVLLAVARQQALADAIVLDVRTAVGARVEAFTRTVARTDSLATKLGPFLRSLADTLAAAAGVHDELAPAVLVLVERAVVPRVFAPLFAQLGSATEANDALHRARVRRLAGVSANDLGVPTAVQSSEFRAGCRHIARELEDVNVCACPADVVDAISRAVQCAGALGGVASADHIVPVMVLAVTQALLFRPWFALEMVNGCGSASLPAHARYCLITFEAVLTYISGDGIVSLLSLP